MLRKKSKELTMRWTKDLFTSWLILMAVAFLTSCGVNVGNIRSVDTTSIIGPDMGVVVGRVRFVVDGSATTYTLLNRPTMRLFRFSDGQYYEAPMIEADGSFVWSLPRGDYEIAVLFGGMGPIAQPMLMRDTGMFLRVNGFTYPGYRLSSSLNKTFYLGTLVVDVKSRKMNALIDFTGERVFDSLNSIEVVDESANDAKWQTMKNGAGAEIKLFEPLARH